jgi:D-alanine-D-alanine ligase
VIKNLPEGSLNIATGRLKWNTDYQKKVGLVTRPADLSEELQRKLITLSKRIYRHLNLSGYAVWITGFQRWSVLPARSKPQPLTARNEDFDSAAHGSQLPPAASDRYDSGPELQR